MRLELDRLCEELDRAGITCDAVRPDAIVLYADVELVDDRRGILSVAGKTFSIPRGMRVGARSIALRRL